MKRTYLLAIIFLWTCDQGPTGIQEGTWELVREAQEDVRFAALHFVDRSRGWAVGDGGTIHRTIDSGRTWTTRQVFPSSDLRAVQFIDCYNGWAVGRDNTVLVTSSAGDAWSLRAPEGDASRTFTDLYFTDEATGWVVHDQGELLHTGDGGATWDVQLSWENGSALMAFVNDQIGYVRPNVDTVLYKTRDGGQSWEQVSTKQFHWARDMFFADEEHGWIPASTAPS